MKRSRFTWLVPALLLSLQAVAQPSVTFSDSERRAIDDLRWVEPPADPSNRFSNHPGAALFGQYLFFDTGFSANGDVACVTCHQPALGFADGKQLAAGLEPLSRHAMSLWQVAFQRWFFWDGRADSLWAQALQPFEDPREMATTRLSVLHRIHRDHQLKLAYERVFGPLPPLQNASRFPQAGRPLPNQPDHPHHLAWSAMTREDRHLVNQAFANLGKAIAAYERQLVAGDTPFDRFAGTLLEGGAANHDEFPLEAQQGLKLFIGKANCRLCHNGPNFSDGEFHNNGVPPLAGGSPRDSGRWQGIAKLLENPFNAAGPFSDAPDGQRATATQSLRRQPEQWGQFRTPSLRQASLSPPYMHQGQLESLSDVVHFYATLDGASFAGHHREPLLQPLDLSDEEKRQLVAFLKTLTTKALPKHLLQPPQTPDH